MSDWRNTSIPLQKLIQSLVILISSTILHTEYIKKIDEFHTRILMCIKVINRNKWDEQKIAPDSPEPYNEAFREIERGRDTSREMTKNSFSASLPRDTWKDRVNKSTSIRSYMGIIGALKSVSPNISIDPKKMNTMKNSIDLHSIMNSSQLITKEEEEALKGRDAEKAAE